MTSATGAPGRSARWSLLDAVPSSTFAVALLLWVLGFTGSWLSAVRNPAVGLRAVDVLLEPLIPALCLLVVQALLARRDPSPGVVRLVHATYLLMTWGWLLQGRVDVGSARATSLMVVVASGALLVGVALGPKIAALSDDQLPALAAVVAGASVAIIAVTAFAADDVNGSRTSIDLGIAIQPGELARLGLVVAAAAIISRSVAIGRPTRSAVLRLGVLTAAACAGLLVLQRDFSPAFLFLIVLCFLVWIHHGRGYLAASSLLGAGVLVGLSLVLRDSLDPRGRRFRQWWNPYDPLSPSDGILPSQLGQGLLAYRRGGFFGEGWGLGHPQTVPLSQSDFVLAVAAEELGSVGLLVVLAGAVAVTIEGWRIVARLKEGFLQLLAAGLVCVLMLGWLLTVAGTFGLIPHGGLAIPFLSRGGSSLVASALAVGLLVGLAVTPCAARAGSIPIGGMVDRPTDRLSRLAGARGVLGLALVALLLQLPLPGPDRLPRIGKTSPGDVARAEELVDRDYEQANIERGRILAVDGTVLAETAPAGGDACPRSTARSPLARPERCYPEGSAYADVVGALTPVNPVAMEDQLAEVLSDCVEPTGSWWSSGERRLVGRTCTSHPDVRLTLDPELQELGVRLLRGRLGTVVAIDPRTGAVRALVSTDQYDPTAVVAEAEAGGPLRSYRASLPRQVLRPAGSVIKLVTVAAAVEAGRGEPVSEAESQATVLPGESPCSGTVRDIVATSCNRATAALADRVGAHAVDDMAAALGFGAPASYDGLQVTCSPLPMGTGSGAGCLASEQDRAGRRASGLAFVPVTAVQLATVGMAIANDGAWPEPTFVADAAVRKAIGSSGEPELHRAMRPDTAHELLAAMAATATEGGTAAGRFPPSLDVAAKTGTPQRLLGDDVVQDAWVLAVAPIKDPQLVVVVWLAGEPGGAALRGADAAPVARAILEAGT